MAVLIAEASVLLVSVLVLCNAQDPPAAISVSVQPGLNFIDVRWPTSVARTEILSVGITIVYLGPCGPTARLNQHIVLVEPGPSTYRVPGLEEYGMYTVDVVIAYTVDEEPFSTFNTFMTTTLSSVPDSSPTNLRFVESTLRNITVAWKGIPCFQQNSIIELNRVSLSSQATPTVSFDLITSQTSYTFSGLNPDTEYSISLEALYTLEDDVVRTVSATPITATTFAIPGPYNFRVDNTTSTSISVSWDQEEPLLALIDYEVLWEYMGSCETFLLDPLRSERIELSSREHTFMNLTAFGIYRINITVFSNDNQSATTFREVQTLSGEPSSFPSSLNAATIEPFSVTLSWNELTCEEAMGIISSYRIIYGTDLELSSDRIVIQNVTNTTYRVGNLTHSTVYLFNVVAVSREGSGGPVSPGLRVVTETPPPPPSAVAVASSRATSIELAWIGIPEIAYTIATTYEGPCTDIRIPPRIYRVEGASEIQYYYNVTNLEEFSSYAFTITPERAREFSSLTASTLPSDPTLSDDHVQLISTTNFTITLRIPNIACIDQNGDISEFRISYAETSDFIEGVNLKNGFFSPGVLTIGNLSPGRNYTFQLTVTTVHGGRAVLEPVEAETDSGALPVTTEVETTATVQETSPTSNSIAIIVPVAIVAAFLVIIAVGLTVMSILVMRSRCKEVEDDDDNDKDELLKQLEREGKRGSVFEGSETSRSRNSESAFFNNPYLNNLEWLSSEFSKGEVVNNPAFVDEEEENVFAGFESKFDQFERSDEEY